MQRMLDDGERSLAESQRLFTESQSKLDQLMVEYMAAQDHAVGAGEGSTNQPPPSHHLLATTHNPPSTIHHSPSTIHHPQSTTHHPPLTIHHPPPTTHHPPPTTHHPPPTTHHSPSTICHPPGEERDAAKAELEKLSRQVQSERERAQLFEAERNNADSDRMHAEARVEQAEKGRQEVEQLAKEQGQRLAQREEDRQRWVGGWVGGWVVGGGWCFAGLFKANSAITLSLLVRHIPLQPCLSYPAPLTLPLLPSPYEPTPLGWWTRWRLLMRR